MSYLEILRARRKTPVSTWHKLRTSIATKKFDFYVAFEGEEDEEFYSGFLAARFPGKKFRPLICDGKGGVIALHQEVLESYGSPLNVFFFIDADHDRFLGQDDYPAQTFSTCGYAVENYIYDPEVILKGIRKHFQLNPADELCAEVQNALERDRDVFEVRARTIMSYSVALRTNDQSPDLDKVDLNSIFELNDDGLKRRKIDCAALLAAGGVAPLTSAEIYKHARLLRNANPNVFFRGKLVSQFVVNFCRRLAKRFRSKQKLNGKPLKAKIEFGKNNLISAFVDFVEAPDRLLEFFEEMEAALGAG
jgi:hypothetical protein